MYRLTWRSVMCLPDNQGPPRDRGETLIETTQAAHLTGHPNCRQAAILIVAAHNPVIRSHYRNGFIKQYVRDHLILRTEPATNNVTDYGVNKAIEHLPALRDKMAAVIDNYLDVQQDILETFVDRGQLRKLAQPTLTATGKRIPGLKLDNPRQLALMHALVRFAQIPPARTFSTAEIYPHTLAALGSTTQPYSLASL